MPTKTKPKPHAKPKAEVNTTKPDSQLTTEQAAKLIGVPSDFLLNLALSGARKPTDQGGQVIEIDYAMEAGELTFTKRGVERFIRQCPVGEMLPTVKVQEQLGVQRAQVSVLAYTGVATSEGKIVRLPVWVIGGREYVDKADLKAFAVHFKHAVERKAEREKMKRYKRPAKPAAEA